LHESDFLTPDPWHDSNGDPICDCEDEIYSDTPNQLGCPHHKPTKMWCLSHNEGFYKSCGKCNEEATLTALKAILYQIQKVRKYVQEGMETDTGEA